MNNNNNNNSQFLPLFNFDPFYDRYPVTSPNTTLTTTTATTSTTTTITNNLTNATNHNSNDNNSNNESTIMATCVLIMVPVPFAIITIVGLVGNLFVIITVATNKQMRSTTNILILNLALADLLFVIICVPTTGTSYVFIKWPFGLVLCRMSQYMVHVTAYASILTLVLMSVDRYLAVVHPIQSMTIRTTKNACVAVAIMWLIICSANLPLLFDFNLVDIGGDFMCINERLVESLQAPRDNQTSSSYAKTYHSLFFLFGLFLPLLIVILLYALMVDRLMKLGKSLSTINKKKPPVESAAKTPTAVVDAPNDKTKNDVINNANNNNTTNNNASKIPNKCIKLIKDEKEEKVGEKVKKVLTIQQPPHQQDMEETKPLEDQQQQNQLQNNSTQLQNQKPSETAKTTPNRGSENMMAKRRVTKMVIIVIAAFAVCWIPIHIVFLLQSYFPSNFDSCEEFICARIFTNCLAYMNSCINPILYAFLSENFRNSFRRLCFGCVSKTGSGKFFNNNKRKFGDFKASTRFGNNNNNFMFERTSVANITVAVDVQKVLPVKDELIRSANKRRFKFLIKRARGLEAMRLRKLNQTALTNGDKTCDNLDGDDENNVKPAETIVLN